MSVEKELFDLYEKYRDFDFESCYKNIALNNHNNRYSKGLGFRAGLYEPSFVNEMRITNCTIGKEVKEGSKYDYKYYFDTNDKIILSEKYLDDALTYLNLYFYHGDFCDHVFYDYKRNVIFALSKSFFDEKDRLIRFIEIDDVWANNGDFYNNTKYEEHLFKYEDGVTFVTQLEYWHPCKRASFLKDKTLKTQMKIIDNVLYYLKDDGSVSSFYNIRFKIEDGKKVSVPLPKKINVFKVIKDNFESILSKWKDLNISVIWICCESTDLTITYTTKINDCEEKWNIAFYDDSNEEEIFTDKNHIQIFEDWLFNNDCNIDDLINESEPFIAKMIKIIKELRVAGYINDSTAVIISALELSENTFNIAKKINKKEIINPFINL